MTAISAIISKNWIATASDSLLTEFNPNTNQISHIEFRKSKIVPIHNFKAAATYWGLAKIKDWRTYDFIKELAGKSTSFDSFEDFANNLKEKLKEKLDSYNFTKPIHKGIGIHLIGYEKINSDYIPELFLISNYTDPSYTNIGELRISRNLYGTLPDDFKNNEITSDEKRNRVVEFLNQGRIFVFNNGDPILYNPAANAIFNMFMTATDRKVLKKESNYKNYMRLVSIPIEMIKKVQSSLFEKDYVRVGGKIHHLLITKRGDFFSDTGDNKF